MDWICYIKTNLDSLKAMLLSCSDFTYQKWISIQNNYAGSWPKFSNQIYLPSIYISMQKITLNPCCPWDITDLRVSKFDWMRFFWPCLTNNLQTTFCFFNLYLHAKNQVDLSILTWYLHDSGILQSDWPRAFLTLPNQKNLHQLLSFFNLS